MVSFKKFAKSVFQKITIAYPQNNETKHYLKQIGKINLNKIGNLKFWKIITKFQTEL